MTKTRSIFFLILILLASCTKIKVTPPQNLEIHDFILKGLNTFYLWQSKVPDLSDNRFLNTASYEQFLASETDADQFFENLIYQRNTVDKWSWIVEDYVALENSFQGISVHNGMEFGLVFEKDSNRDLFAYVRYVLPNTDASEKEVKRGMIFNKVNGSKLNINNYRNLLFSGSLSYTIHLADYNDGNPTSNGTTIDLSKSAYTENPIFLTKIIEEGAKKIGYIMYNSFTSSFDQELNAAFLTFKNSGITDLIFDVRYNGGGSVQTAVYVSSMITGQFKDQLFSRNEWNDKININDANLEKRFTDLLMSKGNQENINSVFLDNVYFITTKSSASASELVMNGLSPYINVHSVGTQTHGKYVGSVTLYDSPNFFTKENINPNHTWAMQPIVIAIKNKLGENRPEGFEPSVLLQEDYKNLGVLGETSDPLLARTIQYITTGAKGKHLQKTQNHPPFFDSKLATPTGNNMYIQIK